MSHRIAGLDFEVIGPSKFRVWAGRQMLGIVKRTRWGLVVTYGQLNEITLAIAEHRLPAA